MSVIASLEPTLAVVLVFCVLLFSLAAVVIALLADY
jgi:hypothetical protein